MHAKASSADKHVELVETGSEREEGKKMLKIKSLDGQVREIDLSAFVGKTIKDLKQSIYAAEVLARKSIKLIFRGRVVQDAQAIDELELFDGCFMHVSIVDENLLKNSAPVGGGAVAAQNADLEAQQNNGDVAVDPSANFEQMLNNRDGREISEEDLQQLRLMLQREEFERQRQFQQRHETEGTRVDLFLGFLVGYIFHMLGLMLIICFSNCKQYKRGAFIGFIVRSMILMAFQKNMQQQQ